MITCTFSGTSCGTGVPDSKSPATEPVCTWSKDREETRVTKAETDLNTKFNYNVKYKQTFIGYVMHIFKYNNVETTPWQ